MPELIYMQWELRASVNSKEFMLKIKKPKLNILKLLMKEISMAEWALHLARVKHRRWGCQRAHCAGVSAC